MSLTRTLLDILNKPVPRFLVCAAWSIGVVGLVSDLASVYNIPILLAGILITILVPAGGLGIVAASLLPQYRPHFLTADRVVALLLTGSLTLASWVWLPSRLPASKPAIDGYEVQVQSSITRLPIGGAEVSLVLSGTPPKRLTTDDQGHVLFPREVLGNKDGGRLIVEVHGYDTANLDVEFSPLKQPTLVLLHPR